MKHIGENVVRIEAEALRALADRIGGPMAEAFNRAVELLCDCRGRVVVTGMGKSGIIARKGVIRTMCTVGAIKRRATSKVATRSPRLIPPSVPNVMPKKTRWNVMSDALPSARSAAA